MQNNISLISRGEETKTRHADRVFRKRIPNLTNEATSKLLCTATKAEHTWQAASRPPRGAALPLRTAQRPLPPAQPEQTRDRGQPRDRARPPQGTTRAGRGRTALQAQPTRPVRETGGATALRPQLAASPPAWPRGAHRGIPARGPPGPSRRAAASTGRGQPGPAARRRPPPSWPPPRTWRWRRPS